MHSRFQPQWTETPDTGFGIVRKVLPLVDLMFMHTRFNPTHPPLLAPPHTRFPHQIPPVPTSPQTVCFKEDQNTSNSKPTPSTTSNPLQPTSKLHAKTPPRHRSNPNQPNPTQQTRPDPTTGVTWMMNNGLSTLQGLTCSEKGGNIIVGETKWGKQSRKEHQKQSGCKRCLCSYAKKYLWTCN